MSELKVLQFSTHNEDCGIAKYQEQFVSGMSTVTGLTTEYFELSPNKTKLMNKQDLARALDKLKIKLKDFDILHIQHELSFFHSTELEAFISTAKKMKKKVIVTVHTAPDAQLVTPVLGGFSPKSFFHFARQNVSKGRFLKRYVAPLYQADIVIVHNETTKNNLIKYGVQQVKIQVIRHPVPVTNRTEPSTKLTHALNVKAGDVIIASVGFISVAKGSLQAIKALKYLPDNYKLAIIGGVHPDSQDTSLLDHLSDVVLDLGISDRVHITGFIEDDQELNALVAEADVCVFPYDKKYYSYVSSGSLNVAIANNKPLVAYHTDSLDETNTELEVVKFCKSPNYYELARTIKDIDLNEYSENSRKYAELFNWNDEAVKFVDIYRSVIEP